MLNVLCKHATVCRGLSNLMVFICSYREPEEVKQVRKERDPIKTLSNRMIDGQVATKDELKVCVNRCSSISVYHCVSLHKVYL